MLALFSDLSTRIRSDIKEELRTNMEPLVGRVENVEAKVEENESRLERYERDRRENNLMIEFTSPYTPQMNGVVERRSRTLLDMVRFMWGL